MSHKKIIIIILGILIVIALAFGIFWFVSQNKMITYSSFDNTYSVQVPKKLNITVKTATNDRDKLDFYSLKKEVIFSSSMYPKQTEVNLPKFIEDEKTNLPTIRENIRDLSDTKEISIQNYKAYEYSYTSYDSDYGSDLYTEIIWIETEKNIYVLDMEVISQNAKQMKPIFDNIKNSFIEISE